MRPNRSWDPQYSPGFLETLARDWTRIFSSSELRVKATRLVVHPTHVRLAHEVLLRAEALSAPLHKLCYRWSLLRRAPAWKQRWLRERKTRG